MDVIQIRDLVNQVTNEVLGTSDILLEDLSNVVDVGNQIINANQVDGYVRSLVNHIGRVIFVNRKYKGSAPSVLMDGWEFGSIMEKIQAELPMASENESWELQNGASYDQQIFYKPEISAKFYNKKVTFEIHMSFTEKQVKQSFSNASQLNGFLSMIYTAVENSLTIKIDELIMRTINNMTAETIYNEYGGSALNTKSTIKAVNLLYLYNQLYPDNILTADKALKSQEFTRFAVLTLKNYMDRLHKISTLFNIGGKARFTPDDMLHVIMLSDFKNSADVYLQSDTFNEQYTALPNADTVVYWQGSGNDYSFDKISDIHVKTSSGNEVNASGILAVMFDRDALGVTNLDRRVTTAYNAKAEFYNNYYKFDAGYFNDLNENFIVFFIA